MVVTTLFYPIFALAFLAALLAIVVAAAMVVAVVAFVMIQYNNSWTDRGGSFTALSERPMSVTTEDA